MNVIPTMFIVASDLDTGIAGIRDLADFNGDRMISLKWNYEFDTGLSAEHQIEMSREVRELMRSFSMEENRGVTSTSVECQESERSAFYNMFGSLFYLGIILSIVFIFAAVLIIYYKQISEGYEDQARFEIMQKVGMTKKEIRRSINSQLLTVFFLPLIGAGCHLAFAFPIIRKLLLLFNLNNVALFAATTIISFLVFALFYTIVYRVTSNAYYHIVSGAKEEK